MVSYLFDTGAMEASQRRLAKAIDSFDQILDEWERLTITNNSSYTIRDRTNGPIGQTNLRYGHVHILKRNTNCPSQIPSAKSVCEDHFIFNGQEERSVHQSVLVPNRENVVFSKKSNIGGQYYDLTTSIEDTTADDAKADVEDTMLEIEDVTANETMADVEDEMVKSEVMAAEIKQLAESKNFVFILTDNYFRNESPAAMNHDFISYDVHGTIHCEWLLGAHDLKAKSKWLVKMAIVTVLGCYVGYLHSLTDGGRIECIYYMQISHGQKTAMKSHWPN